MQNLWIPLLLAAACLWPLSAHAQSTCANSSLNGTYFYVLSGNVYSATQKTYVPYAEAGKFIADGNGNFSGQGTASFDYAITSVSLAGNYNVLANCTGTIPLSRESISIQVVSGGQSIAFVSTSSNVVLTGHAYRPVNATGGQCGNGSLSGTYGYVMTGAAADANGEYFYSEAGQITADGNGNLTDTNMFNLGGGGTSVSSTSGTYTINSDCSGTATINYPDGKFFYDMALAEGNNVLFLEADAGTAVAGTGQLQSIRVVLPQFVFGSVTGGGWYSALYFTNSNSNSVSFTVNFTTNGGTPLTVPSLGGSSVAVTIAPHGTAILEAPNTGSFNDGFASVTLPAGVTGSGIFRQSVTGRADQEAVVPFAPATSTTSTLAWDETGGAVTAVAIANPSAVAASVEITVWDTSGTLIGTSPPVLLPANSKIAGGLDGLSGLSLAGIRGSAQFTVSTGNVAVLGLQFAGVAFTSVPASGN